MKFYLIASQIIILDVYVLLTLDHITKIKSARDLAYVPFRAMLITKKATGASIKRGKYMCRHINFNELIFHFTKRTVYATTKLKKSLQKYQLGQTYLNVLRRLE